jgi:hypothetical protein
MAPGEVHREPSSGATVRARHSITATTIAALAALSVAAAPNLFAGVHAAERAAGDTSIMTTLGTGQLEAGFGARTITPVGPVPVEWAPFMTPHPVTQVWGEPYTDLDGDGCYSGLTNEDLSPVLDAKPPTGATPEPFVDQPWNSSGDAYQTGAFSVDGVTIYGDPDSTGKWDGVWGNAGFGAICALGMHDDTWARAVVLESGDATVAMVSLDIVGLFNIEVQRMRLELVARYPEMEIDELVVSSTHTHEGVDTMGYWGQLFAATDGKYPTYQAFMRSQTIDAIYAAWSSRQASDVKLAHGAKPMRIRDSRPPEVTDDEVLTMQFLADDGSTIGTLVNWSNHPEAQGSNNPLISSDFPHATREAMEAEFGGTSIFFTGAVGGLQTPLGVDIEGFGSAVSWERTSYIGELVAASAIAALADAEILEVDTLRASRRTFYLDSDNNVLRTLNATGVFDLPTFTGGESWGSDPAGHAAGVHTDEIGPQVQTEMVLVQLGPAMFLTVPGELSPELELGGFGRPSCPSADTGRPYEPAFSDTYNEEYRFVLGLGQDELGYIIPGYDFHLLEAPGDASTINGGPGGLPGIVPLGGVADEHCGEGHYEETVSISSAFAPYVACVAQELAGRDDVWDTEPACSRLNTHTNPYGLGGSDGRSGQMPSSLTAAEARQAMVTALRDSHGHSHLPIEDQQDAGIDWGVAESSHDGDEG